MQFIIKQKIIQFKTPQMIKIYKYIIKNKQIKRRLYLALLNYYYYLLLYFNILHKTKRNINLNKNCGYKLYTNNKQKKNNSEMHPLL